MPHGGSTTHRGNAQAMSESVQAQELRCCGGRLYLEFVIGIRVNFKEITKGKWIRHQSLGFF